MDLHLKDKIAVVTGGASGIGRAVAELFATEGAHVALWDVSPQTENVAGEIQRLQQSKTIGLTADLTQEPQAIRAVCETELQLGPIDCLVHCAAIGSGKFGFPFTNLAPADWKKILDVNIMGMVHVAHAVSPRMTERGRGAMVFLASVAGQIGSQTDPPYSASKAANINFAQCLAKDLAPHGIRVNTVCPGMVKTPLNQSVWKAWHDLQPEDKRQTYDDWAAAKIRQVVPLGHWQEPADIAQMIVFLCSERCSQVTGQTINVDGGFVMHW